jgi:hypothetical protein
VNDTSFRQPLWWDGRAFIWGGVGSLLMFIPDGLALRLVGVAIVAALMLVYWANAKQDRAQLAFLSFVVFLTVLEAGGGADLREAVVPYTGWSPVGAYTSCLFFVVTSLWSGNVAFRRAVMALLALQLFFGVLEWLSGWPRSSPNPYLRVEIWRPLWSVGVPLFWLAVLLLREKGLRCRGSEACEALEPAAEREDAADEGVVPNGLRS